MSEMLKSQRLSTIPNQWLSLTIYSCIKSSPSPIM